MFRTLLFTLLLAAVPLQAGNMVVFGDSLSDGGYYLGTRFVDPGGELWHEYLADALGLARATTSSFGTSGLNLAIGGSKVANLQAQFDRYKSRYTWRSGDLCTLWIGGNDVRSNPNQNMTALADQIGSIISKLAALGVNRFVVPNLPDIGAIPESLGDPVNAPARTAGTIAFNNALAAKLDTLSGTLPITIHQLNVYKLFEQMCFYPADYDFVNVTDPLETAPAGTEPRTYAFWDEIHPTTRSHYLISAATRPLIDPDTPIEFVSRSLQGDLSLRQTWLANPQLTYAVFSGSDVRALEQVGSLTDSPAFTVVIPAPSPHRGFYQTRVAP